MPFKHAPGCACCGGCCQSLTITFPSASNASCTDCAHVAGSWSLADNPSFTPGVYDCEARRANSFTDNPWDCYDQGAGTSMFYSTIIFQYNASGDFRLYFATRHPGSGFGQIETDHNIYSGTDATISPSASGGFNCSTTYDIELTSDFGIYVDIEEICRWTSGTVITLN